MKRIIILLISVLVIIALVFILSYEKDKYSLSVEKIDTYKTYMVLHVSIKNNTSQDIEFDGIASPIEYAFSIEDIKDTSSIISPIPLSNINYHSLIILPKEKFTAKLVYLAKMSSGDHTLKLSFISENNNNRQKIVPLSLKDPLTCENFSKVNYDFE